MRIHRNVAEAIIKGLKEIHHDENLATYVVPKLLKSNKKWGSRDRSQIAESIYDITRYWLKFKCITGAEEANQKSLWKILGAYLLSKETELPAWDEFADFKPSETEDCNEFTIDQSIPKWLDEFGRNQLGDKTWEQEIIALNQPAAVVLRINPLALPKNTTKPVEFVQEQLAKQNVLTELVDDLPNAIQLLKRKSILHTKAYQKGWVEIQDANSQHVAIFAEPKKESLIIDICAGSGGKSLHFASLVENEADIFALDVVPHKIKELSRRAERARVNCIESGLVIEFPIDDFLKRADIVLIDAPCSGFGTLKRDPDRKWKLTKEFIDEIVDVQQEILQRNAHLVKSKGSLVYATCSVLPIENQDQIKSFLNSEIGKEFSLEKEKVRYAHKTGYDGFYMARLVRS